MYRAGHYGVSLLVYAPVLAVLLAVDRTTVALVGALVMLGLATVPDYDQRIPFVRHRGSTHTLAFAWLVGITLGGFVLLVPGLPHGSKFVLGGFAVFIGVLGVVAHLLGDVLTASGVAFLWPFSPKRYSLSLVQASDALANYALLLLGLLVTLIVVATTSV